MRFLPSRVFLLVTLGAIVAVTACSSGGGAKPSASTSTPATASTLGCARDLCVADRRLGGRGDPDQDELGDLLQLSFPAFGGHASYYWAYGALGRDVPQVAVHIVTHPLGALRLFIARAGKPARTEADGSVSTVGLCAAAAMCAVGVYLIPRFALGPALHSSFCQRTAEQKAAAAAVAAVPGGVTVEP